MQVEYKVGTQAIADGAMVPPTIGHQGQTQVDDTHARYYHMAYRTTLGEANAFCSCTGTAGVAPGTVLSTTPPFALWNPAGSGKNLYILRTSLGYVSGTLGLGQLWYGFVVAQNTKPTTGTVLTVTSTCIGVQGVGVGQAFQGSTLVATPSVLRPSPFNWGPYAGGTATLQLNAAWSDEIGGNIMVTPGSCFVMQAVAGAGTTPLMVFGCEWGEEKV